MTGARVRTRGPAAAAATSATRATPKPLALPPPAVIPVLPGLSAIEMPAPAPLPVSQPATTPPAKSIAA